ncbi:MAG: hypothetical protein ACHQIL_12095 [Steroidobacterales bacterium]
MSTRAQVWHCGRRVAAIAAIGWMAQAVAGCASSGAVRTVSAPAGNIVVAHEVARVTATSTVADAGKEVQLLSALVISGLEKSGKFERVTGSPDIAPNGAGVAIAAEIRDLRGVSEAGRIWFGGLAGRARLLVHVTLTDASTSAQLEGFDAEGRSSGGTIFAGTTDQAIQRAAEQIVAEVVKLRR